MLQPRSTFPFPFYYGWIVVGVSSLTLTLAWSVRVTFTAFYPEMVEDLGWSSSSGTLGYSFSWLLLIVFFPISGYLFDRFGPRRTVAMGASVLVAGLALLSTVTSLWAYILYFGLFVGFGLSLLLLSSVAVLPRWFTRRKGRIQGIVATGYAIGPIILLPLMTHFISSVGWRGSFLIFSSIIGALVPIALLFCRGYPQDVGQFPDGRSVAGESSEEWFSGGQGQESLGPTLHAALGTASFWFLAVSFFFGVISYNILLVHQMAHAMDVGFDKALSARVFGMAGFFTFAGVVAGGALSDRIGREWVFSGGSALAIFGLTLFAFLQGPDETWKIVTYAMATGLGFGFRLPLLVVIPADIFNGQSFGRILGSLNMGSALGGFAGPIVAGFLFDILESYALAFALAAVSAALSAFLVWMAAPRKYRRL